MSDDTEESSDEGVEAGEEDVVTPEDFEDVDEAELLPMHPENARKAASRKPQLMARERQGKALSLRLGGASYAQIAKECGYSSASGAWKAVQTASRLGVQEDASTLRQIQYERYNSMLLRLQPGIIEGEIGSINTAITLMDRINQLAGVLTPDGGVNVSDSNVVIINGDADEYKKRLMEMAGALPPANMQSKLQDVEASDSIVDVEGEDVTTHQEDNEDGNQEA